MRGRRPSRSAKHAGDEFDDGAARTEVAEVAFEGGHRDFVGERTEDFADRAGFVGVAVGGAEAVGVDVADVGGRFAGIAEGGFHGAGERDVAFAAQDDITFSGLTRVRDRRGFARHVRTPRPRTSA